MNKITAVAFNVLSSTVQTLVARNSLIGSNRTGKGIEIFHAANINPAALILNQAIKEGVAKEQLELISSALISQKTKWGCTRYYFRVEEASHDKEAVEAAIMNLLTQFKTEDGIANMQVTTSGLMVTLTPEAAEPNSDKVISIFTALVNKYVSDPAVNHQIQLMAEDVDFSQGEQSIYRFPRLRF